MKRTFLFLAVMCCIVTMMAQNNVITYEAPQKLREQDPTSYASKFIGLRKDSFNVAMVSHTFADGKGTITFAGDVTTIKGSAFGRCDELTSITIPNSVTSIGRYAFGDCYGLHTLVIPNTVTDIGESAFYLVSNVQYTGSATGAPWKARCINGYIENDMVYPDANKKKVAACFTSATGSVVIPQSVDSIGYAAFWECKHIRSVTMSNNVKAMGEYAFYNNYHLESVTLSNQIQTIPIRAFYYANSLQSLHIPSSVTQIGEDAFEACRRLRYIICDAVTPPTCDTLAFYYAGYTMGQDYIPVYVPKNSISAYQTAKEWKRFSNFKDKDSFEMYNLSVQDMFITSATCNDILLDGGSVTYDDATKTLKLNNAKISNEDIDIITAYQDIVMECIGEDTIQCTGKGGAINVEGLTTITGSGSLSLIADTGTAIYSEDGLVIKDGCTVTAQSAQEYAVSVAGESITVDGATLIAKGNGIKETIISCYDLILQNGATIRTNHTYDAVNHLFLNAQSQEAKDDIVIGLEGTGIEEINHNENENVRKVMHNGQLVIIRDGKTYNALGARIN